MPEERYITIVSARKTIALRVSTILYVLMNGKYANIHVLGDQVYRTTMTLGEIEEKIGDGFLRLHPVQYFGDRICEQQIATIRSCCKSIRSKSIDWQMKK